MGTMVGTVITVKELYGIKSADIQFRNGTNSTPLITLEENRKYIVPYFQREIRWTKDNLITLINDVRKGSKFLGNLIFTKRQSDYEILDGQQRTTVRSIYERCQPWYQYSDTDSEQRFYKANPNKE